MPSARVGTQVGELLRPFAELACVGGKIYLGSMFFLDFGRRFGAMSRAGERIEIGEMTVSVRDVAWWLYRGETLLASAETVQPEQFERVVSELLGATVVAIVQSTEQSLEILLTGHYRLLVDLTNQWKTDGDLIEFALPDGRLIVVDARGEVIVDTERDYDRARAWATSPHRH